MLTPNLKETNVGGKSFLSSFLFFLWKWVYKPYLGYNSVVFPISACFNFSVWRCKCTYSGIYFFTFNKSGMNVSVFYVLSAYISVYIFAFLFWNVHVYLCLTVHVWVLWWVCVYMSMTFCEFVKWESTCYSVSLSLCPSTSPFLPLSHTFSLSESLSPLCVCWGVDG